MVWVGRDDINDFTEMELATQRVIDAAITLFDGPATREHLTLILRDTNPGNRFRASTESNSIEFNFKEGISFERLWHDHREGFLRLLAHEIMHTWDRREVRQASEFLSVREWGPNTCWLREGFTEYFANLNLYEAGLYDHDEFINNIQALSTAAHRVNELGKISLIEACMPFWNDFSAMQYVYTEGASLAFSLDLELRRATNGERSMPLFMRKFMEDFRYQEKTVEAFVEAWQAYAPAALADLSGMLEMRRATDLSGPLRLMDAELITDQVHAPGRWSVPETASFRRYFGE
jgi:predicted metalloprotease with PDZ domain